MLPRPARTSVLGGSTFRQPSRLGATPAAQSSSAFPKVLKLERQPRPENVDGSFYVDHTCIDCDACRWMNPEVFGRVGDQSAVICQPSTPEERQRSLQALVACPTFSIHVNDPKAGELSQAQDSFPVPVPGCPSVFHTGFHDEKSYGAVPYLIVRAQGNILVDCPRFTPRLASKLKAMGGVKFIFLTHEDDVGDHAKWADAMGALRIIHKAAVNKRQGTHLCEVQLEGGGSWTVEGEMVVGRTAEEESSCDVELIHTPGHTWGSMCLLFRPQQALFSGDHLAFSHRLERLTIFRAYNWGSVEEQLRSVRKLRVVDFLHLLPGHGRSYHFDSHLERMQMLDHLLEEEC